MWQAFSAAARQAMEEQRTAHAKIFWLLADACSMLLAPQSPNDPFKPYAIVHDRRSAIPDDMPESEITFFAEIVGLVDDPWLSARLADLIWLKQKPRHVRYALTAIDNYRSIPLDTETWIRGGRECWERATALARMLRAGAGTKLSDIEASVLAAAKAATAQDGFLLLWLTELLAENGLARTHSAEIAERLGSLGHEFESVGDLHRAREHLAAAAQWFKRAHDDVKTVATTVALAECWAKEAVARVSSSAPSYASAAMFYENAIQTYRTIPRAERGTYRVDERIDELRNHLTEAGEKSIGEMGRISSPGIDITQIVEHAQAAVRGKDSIDALRAFVNLAPVENAGKLRDNAIKSLRDHPLQALFPATMMSSDGRVIAKRPGTTFGNAPEDEIGIRAQMIRDRGLATGLIVQGEIVPALEVMLHEHRLTLGDFVALARQSPIVPPERELLFGKGLFAGYDGDFISALHLLVPQLEHMVRHHLKRAGAKTTNLDSDGIETENGLSTLMEMPEAETVFGKDLVFELRALLCDAFGPNLRNELAHGLLDDGAGRSVYSIYTWWLALKLVFNNFWMSTKKAAAPTSAPPSAP